jgi:predicted metalloprotease with PDZ domain
MLDFEVKLVEGKLMITKIHAGTFAYESGLNFNDEIIAIDGIRMNEELLNNIRQLSVDIQFYAHSIHCVVSNMRYFGEKSRDERVGNLQKYRELLEDLEVKRQNNNKELGRTEEAGK